MIGAGGRSDMRGFSLAGTLFEGTLPLTGEGRRHEEGRMRAGAGTVPSYSGDTSSDSNLRD